MFEFGEDKFLFKGKAEITPVHPRAFILELDELLEDIGFSINPEEIEIDSKIKLTEDEDIAKVLSDLFKKLRYEYNEYGEDAARVYVQERKGMQQLILRAREIVARDQ